MAQAGRSTVAGLARENESLRAQLALCRDINREVDHRAANGLQLVASFLRLQRGRVRDGEAGEVLDAAIGRVEAVAHAHQHFNLHATARDVDLRALLGDLARDLAASLDVEAVVEAGPVTVPARMATQLAVVVNELVVNACKHAFADGMPRRVRVEAGATGNGRLRLSVADGGRGLPPGFDMEAMRGLGMKVVRATAQSLGGEVRALSEAGARVVTVPLPDADGAAYPPTDGAAPLS